MYIIQLVRQFSKHVTTIAILLLAWLAITPVTASATPSSPPYGQCWAIGYADTCNVLITIDTNGALSIAVDSNVSPYDEPQGDDMLVGVENLWDRTVDSIFLSGSNIFGFEDDGASSGGDNCTLGVPTSNGCHSVIGVTGYEGLVNDDVFKLVYFDISDSDNGLVIFNKGLWAGQTAWFSLEGPPDTEISVYLDPPVVDQTISTDDTVSVPEPTMMSLMGLGLLGLAWSRRRSNAAL